MIHTDASTPEKPAVERALPRTALRPKLLSTLRGYDRAAFRADLMAGLIVGVVALPLAIAFAIASGVSPEKGLVTAVVAGFLISALGGSRVQIGGPTGAFVVIVYGIVQAHGMDGLMVATLLGGCMLIALGFAGFGSVIKFIPHPVIVGFTSGIAVIIFTSQVRDLLGLRMDEVPPEFMGKWIAYFRTLSTLDWRSTGISAICLAIIIYWPKVNRKIPGSLVALIVATVLVQLTGLDVETIAGRFGPIPSGLPAPHLPDVSWGLVREMVGPAATIAMLAGIESLLSASVADGMTGGSHRSNMELIAQGVANIASPLFGGMPATGAIARTATNVRNGARTPVAGIIHALVLLLIMMLFGKWAGLIPLCALASILAVVAYNMSEWRTFKALLRSPRGDVVVLLLSFGLTVAVDLTVAIEVGMVVSLLLFMKRMSETVNVNPLTEALRGERVGADESDLRLRDEIPPGVEIFDVQGPLFFGAAQKFEESILLLQRAPRVLIMRIRDVHHIDSSGLHALGRMQEFCAHRGTVFMLAEVNVQPLLAMQRSGLAGRMGDENIVSSLEAAIRRASKTAAAAPGTP